MPPKKKKGSGKKKKGKKSGKKSGKPMAQAEQLSELSKEFYLVQIRDLETRLERYQKRCDELEVTNGQFREKYQQMGDDKKEIVGFLKKSLEQRGEEIADLNDRLLGLQESKDAEKEQYESQLGQIRTDFQEMKDSLTSENMILGGKLASLEEFKVQKEELMAKMNSLEESLKDQDQEHQDEIYKLERKQVVDKDRLKKEMVMRVNQVAAEFRKVSNKQMAETTKRTIRENVSINAQLNKMSDKTMEMIQENDELRAKEKQQRQQIELLEHTEKELAKKNHSNQKIIRMLTEKCKNQEMILAEYEMREEQYQELENENDLFRQQVEATRHEAQALAKDNEILEGEIQRVKGDIAEHRAARDKLETVLKDAAMAIRHALRTHTDEDADQSLYDVIEKRDNMLENLLVLLNSAAAIGVGPPPTAFARVSAKQRAKSVSPMPGSGKGIQRGDITESSHGSAPHYKLGDLGLIPRPTHHIPTNYDKMRNLSQTTRHGSIRKILTSTVSTQTVSAPKAMFFADQLIGKLPASHLEELQMKSVHTSAGAHKKVSAKVF